MENSVEARKRKLAYFWAIVTIIACILVGVGVIMHSNNVLPLFLAVGGVLFGPVCGVMYLIEIKNGVLNIEDDENGEE